MANELKHFGVGALDGAPGRGSGRYPLGSGKNPNQRAGDFLSRIKKLEKEGLSEKEIAKAVGCVDENGEGNTSRLRANRSIARAEERSAALAKVKELQKKGLSGREIAKELGYNNESSVRSLLNEDAEARMNASMKAAKFLKEQVDKKGMVEVGAGVERELGISREKMKEAMAILEIEGYPHYSGRTDQTTNPTNKTTYTVLCPPGTEHREIFELDRISSVTDYKSNDGGETFRPKVERPTSIDSKRMIARYAEDGGELKDGVVEIRRGVKDLSLGESNYAQVRIMVDGTHYIKGMAVYGEDKDFPKGVDIIFNTNKKRGTPLMADNPDDPKAKQVLKGIKEDPDNPFGALIKENGQYHYIGKDGKDHLSPINKTREEGDWNDWADKVPSQFLAKQPMKLVNQQLNLSKANKRAEYEEICSLTNPTLKKHLLYSFAEDCDSAAVKLKAAALPGQKYKVALPLTSVSDKECYCPSIKDGTTVALIRYPHGGTFEIPIVKVNNKLSEGKRVITPRAIDAIGINKHVADRLSGADFDGDTVMAIPIRGNVKVKSTPPLKELEGFDTKTAYPYRKGMRVMGKDETQIQMGMISNLITDMTIKGANEQELARAVKHSMVVIDANKHKLDFKQSEIDNDIPALKRKYQLTIDSDGKEHTSASTLLSRAKNETSIDKRKGQPIINPDGSLSYKLADNLEYQVTTKTGKVVTKRKTQKSTQMADAKDARTLISTHDTQVERAYADYANYHKALANEARKTMINTKDIAYSAAAKKQYKKEFDSLTNQLMLAKANQPKERMANIIANSRVEAKKQALDLDKKQVKKVRQQEIEKARNEVGAERRTIKISDPEYKAIQAGAISPSRLREILRYADKDQLRKQAMPKQQKGFTSAQEAQILAMRNAGYNIADIAERFGVSPSTISAVGKKK